jgi:hypothetical protein
MSSVRCKVGVESGFGGWADEKIESVREAAPDPRHFTIFAIYQKSDR